MSSSKKKRILSLLAAIMAAGQVQFANAAKLASKDDLISAEILATLIQRGHLVVDQSTGELKVKSSIMDILEDNGMVIDASFRTTPVSCEAPAACK